jgi:hypothetical protein
MNAHHWAGYPKKAKKMNGNTHRFKVTIIMPLWLITGNDDINIF